MDAGDDRTSASGTDMEEEDAGGGVGMDGQRRAAVMNEAARRATQKTVIACEYCRHRR
jgi:hypothetical protein